MKFDSHEISFQALVDASSSENSLDDETGVRMVALFDHEEVGSNSAQGAGSPAMLTALSRITNSFASDPNVIFLSIHPKLQQFIITCIIKLSITMFSSFLILLFFFPAH